MGARRHFSAKTVPASPAPVAEEPTGLHIVRYRRTRYFALYDQAKPEDTLVGVMAYKKGAEAVKARLEADAKIIAALQSQLAEAQALTPRFREQAAPPDNGHAWRPPEQLPVLAAEEAPAYRPPAHRRPAPRRS